MNIDYLLEMKEIYRQSFKKITHVYLFHLPWIVYMHILHIILSQILLQYFITINSTNISMTIIIRTAIFSTATFSNGYNSKYKYTTPLGPITQHSRVVDFLMFPSPNLSVYSHTSQLVIANSL